MIKPLVLAWLLASPALAQSQDDLVDAALLPGWQEVDGSRMAALHLTLAPNWKTYWRAPGAAGIPPEFDWSGSTNLESVTPLWPSPEVITLNGMQSIGYLDELVLPLRITPKNPAEPVSLRLQIRLGICEDICIPASLTLSGSLSGAGAPDPLIEAALDRAPLPPDEAGLQTVSCTSSPIEDGLRVEAQLALPRQGLPETVVLEFADPSVWVSESIASRTGPVLTAAADFVPQDAAPFVLDRSGVTITVIGQGHSVEIRGCPAP